MLSLLILFVKQTTAYEMRISDWSSDVCPSDLLERLEKPDVTPSQEQCAIDRDELRHLAHAIAAMPPQTREAFMLRRVHGLPQREIAVRMQLSESTVEKHISRGIRFLIDWFGHRGKTDRKSTRLNSSH